MLSAILKNQGIGNIKGEFYCIDGKGKKLAPQTVTKTNGNGKRRFDIVYNSSLSESIYVDIYADHLICRRDFCNNGKKAVGIRELGVHFSGITFGGKVADDFFYHNENPRVYQVFTIPVDFDRLHKSTVKGSKFDAQAGNKWIDPGVLHERIGRSPYQPFPALLLSNYASDCGLVHGTLSQDVFFHNYLISHDQSKKVSLEVFSSFKDIPERIVSPGEHLIDIWYLGTTNCAGKIDHIFDGYREVLGKYLPNQYGATDINRDNVVWGSWNDGLFRDVSAKLIITEAEYLAKNFPTCRWIQLDDGYAVFDEMAHGIGVPYEKEAGVDHKKFPGGIRAFTDAVRKTGLRPALWIGGFIPKKCKIFREHPEYFINYDYRIDTTAPLDPSIPEVREYMTYALDTLITEWGFDSVKHDFWSYAFEDSTPLLKNHDKSGYEWREWWTYEIRRRLAKDGYFQTGCDIVMGNPFLGKYFTNYRYGIDIGNGHWENVKTNFRWGIGCFATHTGKFFVPNSDSIGLFPGLNDVDAMFCVNYCLTTHSMVEIAGLLSKNQKSPRFAMLKKAVCNPNNGQDVYTAGYDYRTDDIPRKLYFRTGHFTTAENVSGLPLRTIGFFNVEDEEIKVDFNTPEFELARKKYYLTDVWSNETYLWQGQNHLVLPPHGSRLFAVNPATSHQILDGNMRIKVDGKKLFLDYPGEGEFFLSSPVVGVKVAGKEVKFDCREGNGNFRVTFRIDAPGEIEFIWA